MVTLLRGASVRSMVWRLRSGRRTPAAARFKYRPWLDELEARNAPTPFAQLDSTVTGMSGVYQVTADNQPAIAVTPDAPNDDLVLFELTPPGQLDIPLDNNPLDNGDGTFELASSVPLKNGQYTLFVAETDSMGNEVDSNSVFVQVNAPVPPAPPAPTLDPATDDGVSASDHVTSLNQLVLHGSAQAGSKVTVFDNGKSIGTTTAAAGTGAWTFVTPPLANGTHSLTVTATDKVGNSSSASAPLTVTVDTTGKLANPLTDFTSSLQVQLKRKGPKATVTVTNTSGRAIHGPVYLVAQGAGKKKTFRGASGRTHQGQQYTVMNVTQFTPGATLTFRLTFKGGPAPKFTPQILAGFGTP